MKWVFFMSAALVLAGCYEDETSQTDAPVRGLKTHLVSDTQVATVRRFPSILEPTSLNALSFDIGGKLEDIDLQVGQRVDAGQVLAQLDSEALTIQIENAQAGVRSAQAAFDNATETLERQEALFERGSVTKVAVDTARTDWTTRKAQLEQAIAGLESAQDNLSKSVLTAPFDAILNAVEVQSFQTVAAGTTIVTLYAPDKFEVSFSANFETSSQLVVGTPAIVRLADRPDIELRGIVSELGSRADAVSSFPVVVTVEDANPILKAGMAAEIAIELPLPTSAGYSIPLSAIIQEGDIESVGRLGQAEVYVFDQSSSTVVRRKIQVAGVRENALLVIEGLNVGDRVASAGVSFLREGQEVKLLDAEN